MRIAKPACLPRASVLEARTSAWSKVQPMTLFLKTSILSSILPEASFAGVYFGLIQMLLIHEIADTLLRRFRLGQILEVLAKVFQADFSDRAGNSVFPALI